MQAEAAMDEDSGPASTVPASVVAAAVNEPVQVTQISCGSSHSLAVLSCDLMVAWGRGEDGQLGMGDAEDRLAPTSVAALAGAGISAIACGAEYSLAVAANQQRVYAWGWGDFGRLGHGDCGDVFLPKPIAALSDKRVVACSCGDTHTLCVTSDGLLYSFGRNSNGQLGNGRTDDNTTPVLVEALQGQKVTAVSCGAEHSVVATETGQVYAWGWGRYGNVGDGQKVDRLTPTLAAIPADRRIVSVASGWRHSLALDVEGRVYSWGWGSYGQLGHGQRQDEAAPREVEALSGRRIRRIAGGWRHTLATDDQGVLWAWGWNKFGQLGLGRSTPDTYVPEPVKLLEGQKVVDVAAGWRHSICITDEGGFYTWGRGCSGQLGIGSGADSDVPQKVQTLSHGGIDVAALCDDSAAAAAFVAPADRYAVVPDHRSGDAGGSGAVPQSPVLAKRQKF